MLLLHATIGLKVELHCHCQSNCEMSYRLDIRASRCHCGPECHRKTRQSSVSLRFCELTSISHHSCTQRKLLGLSAWTRPSLCLVPGEGVVDTRLLGKPKSFDWSTDSWRQFKFTFLGYAGAVDSRLKQAMIESEALPARDQRVSTQLYFMLVLLLKGSAQRLLEHAGDGEGLLSWRPSKATCEVRWTSSK